MQEKMPVPSPLRLGLRSVIQSSSSALEDEPMNFPHGRYWGTFATGPNPNAFLIFPLLTHHQGKNIDLKKFPGEAIESQGMSASFFERLKALGIEEF